MKTTKTGFMISTPFFYSIQLVIFLSIFLTACGSTPDVKDEAMSEGDTMTEAAAGETSTAAPADDSGVAQAKASADKFEAVSFTPGAGEKIDSIPVITKPPRIVSQCKKEAYVKLEKQSRASIKKGRAATKEGRYGVGFRSGDEYKKWSNMHNLLFTEVSQACAVLSDCAKKHKKKSSKKCSKLAATYDEWQKTVKSFTKKVKTVEHVQPPKLCASPPSSDDLPRCYEQLADKIDKICGEDDEACQDVSACWRSVSFLDVAINQAESACRFVHTKLSKCRGYTSASERRKAKFKQCGGMQKEAKIDLVPVL